MMSRPPEGPTRLCIATIRFGSQLCVVLECGLCCLARGTLYVPMLSLGAGVIMFLLYFASSSCSISVGARQKPSLIWCLACWIPRRMGK